MAEFLEIVKNWFLSLGENYGVNPIYFSEVYMWGAIPFFTLSVGWLVKNYRQKKVDRATGTERHILFHICLSVSHHSR